MQQLIFVCGIRNFEGVQLCNIFRDINGKRIGNLLTNTVVSIILFLVRYSAILFGSALIKVRLIVDNRQSCIVNSIINNRRIVRSLILTVSFRDNYHRTFVINAKFISGISIQNIAAICIYASLNKAINTFRQIINNNLAISISSQIVWMISISIINTIFRWAFNLYPIIIRPLIEIESVPFHLFNGVACLNTLLL